MPKYASEAVDEMSPLTRMGRNELSLHCPIIALPFDGFAFAEPVDWLYSHVWA
jgi:hypothetical protein